MPDLKYTADEMMTIAAAESSRRTGRTLNFSTPLPSSPHT